MILQRLMQVAALFLFLVGVTLAVPIEPSDDEQKQLETRKKVFVAWARNRNPLPAGRSGPRGLEQPLHQNGTWQDVGVWDIRKEITSSDPFLFTLEPGRDSSSYTIVQLKTGKKLAYSAGDLDLDVTYGIISAFILTDKGNTATQVVDAWTLETDEYGRKALGIGKVDGTNWYRSGKDWAAGGCGWFGEDEQGKFCDGFYFINCQSCYGPAAVIEVVEWKG